jgi:hypothetical protein
MPKRTKRPKAPASLAPWIEANIVLPTTVAEPGPVAVAGRDRKLYYRPRRDHHIGRIMLHPQGPQGQPWFWSITARVPQYPHDRGYAATRDEAMAAFKMAWLRE